MLDQDIDEEARRLFTSGGSGFHELTPPGTSKRQAFFEPVAEALAFPIVLPTTQPKQRLPPPEVHTADAKACHTFAYSASQVDAA